MEKELVIIRGGGDIASGTIQKLYKSGFRLLVLEIENPTCIRRTVSFGEAVVLGKMEIEGIVAVAVSNEEEMEKAWANKQIPVIVDEKGQWITVLKAQILVDAILAKRNLGTHRQMADLTIGLGPGFTAGKDVDVVIETKRGHHLGRVIYQGQAAKNTGIPGLIKGCGKERVIHSSHRGKMKNMAEIGDTVKQGQIIAYIDEQPVYASLSGVLRGILRDGSQVPEGFKIADIDPRLSEKENCYTISDKARNIAGGVLEAILAHRK